jgi:hypothetical protein
MTNRHRSGKDYSAQIGRSSGATLQPGWTDPEEKSNLWLKKPEMEKYKSEWRSRPK